MAWNDIPKPRQTPPGEWEDFCSVNFQTWILRCGPSLLAQIRQSGGLFYASVNESHFGAEKTLASAKNVAERAIIEHVRKMLPPYKIIVERMEAKTDQKANVTSLRPES